MKVHPLTSANGLYTAVTIRYANEASRGFTVQAHVIATTDLHTDDEFSFLIV